MRRIIFLSISGCLFLIGCARSDIDAPAIAGATPEQEAERIFAIAQDMENEGKTQRAFAAYHQVIRNFPTTPAGKKAIERVNKAQKASGRKAQGTKKH
jgi:outer membrane protein assembly factor BamD (BamD/ComL family)